MENLKRFLLETTAIILIFSIFGFALGVVAIELFKR